MTLKEIRQNIESYCAYLEDELTYVRSYAASGNWDNAMKRAEEVESMAGEILNYINDAKEAS